jgi:hypothetical protein
MRADPPNRDAYKYPAVLETMRRARAAIAASVAICDAAESTMQRLKQQAHPEQQEIDRECAITAQAALSGPAQRPAEGQQDSDG